MAETGETGQIRRKYISFNTEIPSETRVKMRKQMPISGVIESITFFFPPGCESLVRLRAEVETTRLAPERQDWISLDDNKYVARPNMPVDDQDFVTVIAENQDTVNPHTPSVIVEVRSGG